MLAPSLESELASIPYLAHLVGALFVLVHFGLFTLAVKLILPVTVKQLSPTLFLVNNVKITATSKADAIAKYNKRKKQ